MRQPGKIYPVSIFARCVVMAFLALSFAFVAASAHAAWFCPFFLKKGTAQWTFKQSEFDAAKKSFLEKLQTGAAADMDLAATGPRNLSPTEALALMEATGEAQGRDILSVSKLLSKHSPARKQILKFMKATNVEAGLSLTQIQDLSAKFYLLSNPAYSNLPRFLARRIPPPARMLIRKRIETELAAKTLEKAARNLGLLRASGRIEALRLWLRKNPLVMDSVTTIALNTILLRFTGYAGYPPKLSLTAQKKIPPELLEKIRLHGFDAGYEDAKKIFGASAKFETGWNWARSVFGVLVTGVLVYFIVEHYDDIRMLAGMAFVTKEDLKKNQDETFNCDRIRAEQFQSWKDSFLAFEGREPDPVKDKQEWDETYHSIYHTPCDELKVKFD